MTGGVDVPLLVGEVSVDYTITAGNQENKLRLGGIVHAARGFWAMGQAFAVAIALPRYLEKTARTYLQHFGCVECHIIGYVNGAPNVTAIFDPTEVADQGYDTLLRDEKCIDLQAFDLRDAAYRDILVFPADFDLAFVASYLPETARLHVDAAYDLDDVSLLAGLPQKIATVLTSTSSPLFMKIMKDDVQAIVEYFRRCSPEALILKENRGGSRLFLEDGGVCIRLPAQLGTTINSVGVGDVFAAAYVSNIQLGETEAAWRASYAATAYSQTTYPDQLKQYSDRGKRLSFDEMQGLGGVYLSWERRPNLHIYLAAPDFSYVDRTFIEKAAAALSYHNFTVRRPIQENGELAMGSSQSKLTGTYYADYDLLKECTLVFAIPFGRDPGTLVEIGIAIEAGIPVVVYDPTSENNNTMVMVGAHHYSADLDSCLNAVFTLLSEKVST